MLLLGRQTSVEPVYLDFNSTTPLAPSVKEAMDPFWTEHFMLPGQMHRVSRAVAEAIEQAREQVALMMGCESFEIVFTGGGTEANNLAVLGLAKRFGGGHMLVSALEHESVWQAVDSLQSRGWLIDTIPVGCDGVVHSAEVEKRLREETRLVCVQAANPILGTFQPIREIADLCHSRGVPVHCDAIQVFGKTAFDVRQLRADTVAVSGHKMYGPKGSGALYVRRGLLLSPVTYGETREMGLRPGSENVPGWIGMGAAAKLVHRCAQEAGERMTELTERFFKRLVSQMNPRPVLIASEQRRLSNTLLLELPKDANRVASRARQLILAIARTSTPADEFTRSLQAIGMNDPQIRRCSRISIGWTTSQDQIDAAADLLAEACEYS